MNQAPEISMYRCTGKDVNRIIALAKTIWIPTFKDILPADRLEYLFKFMYDRDKLLAQIGNAHHEFYLLLNDRSEIGYSHIVFSPGDMKLEKIYIHSGHQGRGCGLYLLQQMVDKSAQKGPLPVRLQVNRGNKKAIEFYLKFGFSILASEDFDVGEGHVMDDFIMIYHHK